MPELALQEQSRRRQSLMPGAPRDSWVSGAKTMLPIASGLLLAVMVALPLISRQEFSFMLSKDSSAKADERMQVQEASYRGETLAGEPFTIRAGSALQKTSAIPVILLKDLSAEIERKDGLAKVTAPAGEFLTDENRVLIDGPVRAHSESGYRLEGRKIMVDLNANRVVSNEAVAGELPAGVFRANSFLADLKGERVVLEGGASLRFNQDSNQR